MPVYQYRCECGHTWTLTRAIADRDDDVWCTRCAALAALLAVDGE